MTGARRTIIDARNQLIDLEPLQLMRDYQTPQIPRNKMLAIDLET